MTKSRRLILSAVLLASAAATVPPAWAAAEAATAPPSTQSASEGDRLAFGGDRPDRHDGPGREMRQRGHGPGPGGFRPQGHDGPGFGQGGRGFEALIERFDTNKDGSIAKTEVEAVLAGQIATFDKDGDGSLSLTEYQALWLDQMKEPVVRSFQAEDKDGDAKLTAAELNDRLDQLVRRLDRNSDGTVDAGELEARGPDHAGRQGPPPPPPGPDGDTQPN